MKNIILFSLLLLTGLTSCIKDKIKKDDDINDDDVVCAAVFSSINVTINGGTPDDYFTIRVSTGDTIRLNTTVFNNSYPILDDNFQPILKGKQESFRFVCIKNNAVVVDELYVISANACMVNKISGADVVTI